MARPGRCGAVAAFEPFPPAEARAWLAARGIDAGEVGAMTLAELFAHAAGRRVEGSRAPIGFRA